MKKSRIILFTIALLTQTITVLGQNKTSNLSVADSLYKAKDFNGAVENYTIAINNNRDKKDQLSVLLNKRALANFQLQSYKEVIEDETEAISINPDFGNAYWNRASAYNNTGNLSLAIEDYTKAMQYYQSNKKSLSNLYYYRSRTYNRSKNIKSGIEDLSKALELNSEKTNIYYERALLYSVTFDYKHAIDDFTAAISYNQQNEKLLPLLYYYRGENRLMYDKIKDAINDYNIALNLDPQLKNAYESRGTALQFNGDYELSSQDYQKAISIFQDNSKEVSNLYRYLSDNERYQYHTSKALEYIAQAITKNPNNKSAYWSRARIYSQSGECKLALEEFAKTMNLYKDDTSALSEIHYSIASNYYILNENKKVIDECAASIALNPNYSGPYFLRGKVYLKRMINKDSALSNFNKAILSDTSKSSTSYIFSQLYSGHPDIAKQVLQEQILKMPNSADVLVHYYNMACLYSIMKQPNESIIYLKKAIESGYSKKYAANDEDLDNIRNTPEYIAMMAADVSK